MNEVYKYLINIIKAVLTGGEISPPTDGFDWGALFALSREHKITALIGTGLEKIAGAVPSDIMDSFRNEIKKNIFLDLNQEYEAQRISQGFEQKELKHMVMKGYNIKKMYPETYLRYMCDIDILIGVEKFDEYDAVMAELGYEKKLESDHEHIYQKKPLINIELHKSIVPTYNTDLYEYYGNGWKYAERIENTYRYSYSVENQYVFLVVHLAKHYKASGIGISHFIDIFVINNCVDYDKNHVDAELKKLGLEKFHENVLKLIDFWFCDGKADEMLYDMTAFVFSSGAYGNYLNHKATETLEGIEKYGDEKAIKRAKTIEIIFPTRKRLAENFPILEKYAILYPFCLIYRNVRAVLFRRKKVKTYMTGINGNDEAHMNKVAGHLNDVGLREME